MLERLPFDDYALLRYGVATILLVNALHRIYHPETNFVYLAEPVVTGFPGTPENFAFIVHLTAVLLVFLLIMDVHTHFVASFLGFGLFLVVVMLFLQTPYAGNPANKTLNKLFFDVALRNSALVLLCITIARMSLERKEDADPFWSRETDSE